MNDSSEVDLSEIPLTVSEDEYDRILAAFPMEFDNPALAELLEYFDGLRPVPDRLPARADFDPTEVAAHLPFLMMIEVGPEWLAEVDAFRYRVLGTQVVDWLGFDLTGKSMAELGDPDRVKRAHRIHRHIVKNARPQRVTCTLRGPGQDYCWAEMLFLPLADDGATVDRILVDLRCDIRR